MILLGAHREGHVRFHFLRDFPQFSCGLWLGCVSHQEEQGLLSHKDMTDPSTTGIYPYTYIISSGWTVSNFTRCRLYNIIYIYSFNIRVVFPWKNCRTSSDSSHLRYGLQYLMSYGKKGQTTDLSLHSDCLGNGDDPLAKTFDQVPRIFFLGVFDEFLMVVDGI